MREKELKVPLGDDMYLYGTYSRGTSNSIIIFVHGLPGSGNDVLFVDAAHYFLQEGFSTYRMSLYSPYADARQMKECTVGSYTQDIARTILYFKESGYDRIHIIAHSFGCVPVLSGVCGDCASVCLWEPTYAFSFFESDADAVPPIYIAEIDGYILNWGMNLVVSKEFVTEVENMRWNDLHTGITPTFIAYAEQGVLQRSAYHYYEQAQGKKHLVMITHADHTFSLSPQVRQDLFSETSRWLASL